MKISIKDITSLADQSKKFTGVCDIQEFSYLGSEFSINHVEPFDVVLSMIGSGKLHITFSTEAEVSGACDRCLAPVSFVVPVSVDETVEVSEGQVVSDEEEGPYSFVDGEDIDVDELILNEILVNFPAKILCQDDCKGICPVCGKNRNTESCDCDDTVLDPRMAQFLDVFNSFKEVK
ncbi:uncharacterized protein SAMN02910298_00514 [Pseudobutyrivibrio sp. YE44]|uniref:YceD family protein n=1 Tax=Pseudobutyrivibrio sp. YE44 TaxID=1520802 RepID=UPI000892513A|nr:DUF177 domain-containing protein [Pseudobutyrivibrio sp. YE44]SDB10614.1 uncharacterized protein SAMN02910298_00514 [Pseudobutyrivibrio sp. YE44]